MEILWLCLGAVCAGISAWLSATKLVDTPPSPVKLRLQTIIVALVGGAAGWLIPERAGGYWPSFVRLIIPIFALSGAAVCDIATQRIPNLFPAILAVGFVVSTALDFFLLGSVGLQSLTGGLFGGFIILVPLLLCRFVSRGGIGFGDIKLLSALGCLIGIAGTFSTLLIGQILAVVLAVILLLTRKLSWKDGISFAPWLYFGYLASILLHTF